MNIKKALVLAPHPDDGEFGCGGTIKKLTEQNCEVWYAAFAPCNKSLPENFSRNILFTELSEAAACLGIEQDHILTFDFEVREFPRDRQAILETIIHRLKEQIEPELVLLPNAFDLHQDHQVIYEEGLRAFKHTSALGYELPWNNAECKHNCFIKLNESHISAKNASLQAYQSQSFRNYKNEAFIRSLACVRGTQAGCELAEAFQVICWYL